MKKISWVVGIILILLIVLALVDKSSETTKNQTVKISYIPVSAYWPADVAKAQKLFEKEGINAEFVTVQSANQAYEAVVRGEIDIIPVISLLKILVPELISPGNVKIFSLSDMTADNAFDSIIVKKESSISSINDLKGKKIGVFPGTTGKAFLKVFLEENNIDTSGVQFIELTPPNQLGALSSNSVDALFVYEPNPTIAVENGMAKEIHGSVFAKQFDHSPIVGGVISSKFASENPKLAEKVVDVIYSSYKFLDSNEQETREIIKTAFNLDQNVANKIALTPMSFSENANRDRLEKFADYLVSLGEIKAKPDLSNILYNK